MLRRVHKTVGFCCLNLLEGGDVSAADVEKSIVSHVIIEDAHDERVDALARKDPAFADIAKAARATLEVDFAALRKLRADDASGALKEYFGDGEDPREWKYIDYEDQECCHGRVTIVVLYASAETHRAPGRDRRAQSADEARLAKVHEPHHAAGRDRRARCADDARLVRVLEPRYQTRSPRVG